MIDKAKKDYSELGLASTSYLQRRHRISNKMAEELLLSIVTDTCDRFYENGSLVRIKSNV